MIANLRELMVKTFLVLSAVCRMMLSALLWYSVLLSCVLLTLKVYNWYAFHFKIKTNHLKTVEGMIVSVLRVRDKEEFWICCFFARLPIWVEHCNFWSEHRMDHNQLAELVLYAQLSFVGTFFICNSAVTAWDAIQLQTTFHLITRH